MTPPSEELRALAKSVVTDSIVAQATERLIIQIVEVCAEHEKLALTALEAERDDLAKHYAKLAQMLAIMETERDEARARLRGAISNDASRIFAAADLVETVPEAEAVIAHALNAARAQAFADAIQAVDWSLCDQSEDQDLFMAHRDFFADRIRDRAASPLVKGQDE